jgi:Transcriptional regulator
MPRQPSPTAPPETARGTTKRERILRAAIDVFARNGYFNAKVSEVAKAAGVADGTIYLYFDGKEDLLQTVFREHTRNYLQSLELELAHVRRPEERLKIAIRHHLETLGRDRALAIVAQVELRHSLKFMSLLSQQEVADYLNMLRKIVSTASPTAASAARCIRNWRPRPSSDPGRDGDVVDPVGERVRARRPLRPDRGSDFDGVAVAGRSELSRVVRCAPRELRRAPPARSAAGASYRSRFLLVSLSR